MLSTQRNDNTNVSIYIGTYLKRRRKAVGLTGAQLASRLSISQQQVSRYERGKNAITMQGLLDILQALELRKHDVDDFMKKIFQFYYIDVALEVNLIN
ncbi:MULTISPECIES: helix-turn-helix domain-containing protein [Providencia]|uniref:helix-turn-helix domain-containing protein n=1 Tax=Providencia TaxID=586 RepID=UPI001C5A80A0|nr:MULTISPECIES: helix-turn-helix transcriptional regulator [Providencia]ELR5149890.1 helix-turn-helix transcriptional regulator [Providencia rettgeri]ELR5153267.1 helix-turn-helix transcriptional regulator [Providencia rettgeri]MDR2226413.1 helix-turn-helix domain-containing protein [Providencia sp.]QXX81417.1 helix-turn-helix transcriptional regulator [Providencia sp. R33]